MRLMKRRHLTHLLRCISIEEIYRRNALAMGFLTCTQSTTCTNRHSTNLQGWRILFLCALSRGSGSDGMSEGKGLRTSSAEKAAGL